ncbi:MAG: ABC-F family ATP-binding cassette domain-containing protein [Proteocatella sp.]|nr:ABC-F family ATP-binding cassette domain-containing protein [Proteocatella sp.]NCB70811.1 ABC-F family ATP-binding cassette domain-containing protein [Clostridia bacterium]MBP7907572.1 ABC-F family ATP-binding cassette domain-containing protein [Proteocatella sp.]MBP8653888.1 ABC-F family ATP-binding cassette domain-containing protein [Proteocatella sp.]MBP9658475.1 ABC-F family ATP-binding cassette domain-containing protein [Proteocatella sp.]
MINVTGVGLRFGDRQLFKDVNLKFTEGNCYGVIGANGAGKSTFLKILSGEIEANDGSVTIEPGKRMAVLKQDHFQFDEEIVLNTVIMGHERLHQIMLEKDAIYMKEDFTDEDGMKAAELEAEFAELDGWESESNAASLLMGLGIPKDLHDKQIKELKGGDKVKVLLAQALFGKPDILLLDEPTNHLDFKSIMWLENFLMNLEDSTIIIVSHDRHFLNKVCTHMCDVDFSKIQLYVGNYDFWYESSQLASKLMKDQNKKVQEKAKELQDFIARFSSNASKAKQATSRKKQLEKLTFEDIRPSSRRYPFVGFTPEREVGNELLEVDGITKTVNGVKILDNVSFRLTKDDKVVFMSKNEQAVTMLFKILTGEEEPDSGTFKWGVTTSVSYLPKDNNNYFEGLEINLVDWLRQYSTDKTETFIRGFLGRMLFSGEEVLKSASVLSGGEKVRCMLSRMMIANSNVLVMDDPTNHLDLESITALNEGLIRFSGSMLFSSHDHQFISSIANRIIEITPGGIMDRMMEFDEYLENDDIQSQVEKMYNV